VQIGTIEVGDEGANLPGIWSAVDVVAGFDNSETGIFGDGNEQLLASAASTKLLSKISTIIIHGSIFGSGTHGIDAELVSSITVNDVAESQLTPGARNDFFSLTADTTGETRVNELPPPGP
jgi:predicted polyphosphate/ATP-dependent NAD kinase